MFEAVSHWPELTYLAGWTVNPRDSTVPASPAHYICLRFGARGFVNCLCFVLVCLLVLFFKMGSADQIQAFTFVW